MAFVLLEFSGQKWQKMHRHLLSIFGAKIQIRLENRRSLTILQSETI